MIENAKRDRNNVTTLLGVSDDANEEPRRLKVDPVSNELKVKSITGFAIPPYDDIEMTYDSNNNLTQVQYKSGGTVVATLNMSYDANNNLTSVSKG